MSNHEGIPAVTATLAEQVAALREEKARMQGAARDLLNDAGMDPTVPLIDGIRQLWAQREGLTHELGRLEKQHKRERLEWAAEREQLRTDLRLATGHARTLEGRYGDTG